MYYFEMKKYGVISQETWKIGWLINEKYQIVFLIYFITLMCAFMMKFIKAQKIFLLTISAIGIVVLMYCIRVFGP